MFKAGSLAACKAFAACVVAAAALLAPAACVSARTWSDSPPPSASSPIALADLPAQGRATYALILSGGPFPYDKDGAVFGNRERLLPLQRRGYWREYTVRTPGVRHRGARRIVCGGAAPQLPEVCYYSGDHYASFRVIAP
ncbi:ribonuclease N [Melaminivora suipulveris]|uniref:Ribonuclease N n=1 Tax=Melaminivora suipulveris TaxID=2109913 RepID=A0A2R3QCC2_9BURK|nr:ribonuclease domain-containing protein [Melaminivora suipulveris]AVO49418.1 ribonuclease N [Melaminivora suipulveris]